ncbi:hypothetical protein EXIGLDRAFT_613635, partial [Exidia glandulosa HHB12029]
MFYSRSVFDSKTFRILNPPVKVRFGDDSFVEATGTGDVLLQSPVNSEVRLAKALLVPAFTINLVSIGRLDKSGYSSTFAKG